MHQADASSLASVTSYRDKIVTLERLSRLIGAARHGGHENRPPTIVQCHGCFDIVHPGHVRYLQFAKTQGDMLIVSITGDAQIQKGVQRPYIPQELRAESLAAIAFVDYVVIDPHPTAVDLLQLVRPDVYVKGREYATSDDPRFLAERAVVESHGGRVVFSSGDVVFSSSRIVESMESDGDLQNERLAVVCRRNEVNRAAVSGLLNRASGRRIVVIGDVVVERYVLCDSGAVLTESPMMSLRQLDEKDFLGGAAFIALQLAELDASPVLVTRAGTGPLACRSIAELKKAGIDVRAVECPAETPLRTRFLVDEQKVFKVSCAAPMTLDSIGERRTLDLIESAILDADAVLFHDSGHGMPSPGLLRVFQDEWREKIPFVSAGWSETQLNPPVLNRADLICCSERRLRTALNDRDGSLSTLAYRLLESSHARRLIVTLGKSGLVTFDRPSQDPKSPAWRGRLLSEYLPTFATRVVDRLGAGDALHVASTLSFAVGGGLMQSAYLGALTASLAVNRLGPSPVGIDELRRVVSNRAELHAPAGIGRKQHETGAKSGGILHAAQSV